MTNGDLTFVIGIEAVAQDVTMALRTWQGETPYARNVGMPYLQVIFQRGTRPQAVRFIAEQIILGRTGVQEVLELNTDHDTLTRVLTLTGRLRANGGEIAITA